MSNENKLSTAPAGAVAQKTAGGGALSVFADGASFNTALRMAQCLASSTVVPKEYHGNVGNCMIAIEMASRINTSPMMVMQNLYIVNGRPAWSSQWIIAMINSSRRYKTELQFEFGRDKADGGLSCRAWAEDYSGHKVYGPKITMNMANDEGWTSKNGSKWKTMPDVMIQYRAASFFGRMNCPDMIMGIYSQEEVLDMGELPTDGFALVVDPATGEVTEAEKDEPITQDQRQTLFKMATSAFGQEANGVLKSLLAAEGYVDLLREVVLENMDALDAGKDVVPQQFMSQLYKACSGISYIDIQLYASADASDEKPSQYPDRSKNITARQRAYEWIWEKSNATGHLNAKKMPMRAHENILIFYRRQPTYNPQKTDGHQPVNSYTHYIDTQNRTEIYQKATKEVKGGGNTDRYPRSVIKGPSDKQTSHLHPTQKPVWLCERLVLTYTNPGEVVLDCCAGSASIGVACCRTGRRYIGIENEKQYYDVMRTRLRECCRSHSKEVG